MIRHGHTEYHPLRNIRAMGLKEVIRIKRP